MATHDLEQACTAFKRATIYLFGYVAEWAKIDTPTPDQMANLRGQIAETEAKNAAYLAAFKAKYPDAA